MTKAIPSKNNTEWIWCQQCTSWYEQNSCSYVELKRVNDENMQFRSDYDDCEYYYPSDVGTISVWQCPNDCWIWDPNDGDVDTPSRHSGVMYTCSDCEVVYPDKDEADNCCWKEEN